MTDLIATTVFSEAATPFSMKLIDGDVHQMVSYIFIPIFSAQITHTKLNIGDDLERI